MSVLERWRGLWKKESTKKVVYNVLARNLARKSDAVLNCGIALDEPNAFPHHLAPEGDEALGLQLYWKVCDGILKDGDSLLEIGCGAGDGIAFLANWRSLIRAEGIDFARKLIRLARRRHRDTPICYTAGNAYDLPYSDESFDLALTIEASCCMTDKIRFLEEAKRVLKPDGRLIWSDFFYKRETASHSIARCEEAIESTGWTVESKIDHTAAVVAALDRVSASREAHVEKSVWKPLRGIARDFAVTQESSLYRSLNEGRSSHLLFVLRSTS